MFLSERGAASLQLQAGCIQPTCVGRFGSVFPSLNMAVKRREQALQDYRRLQAKVEKYEEKEKTGPVLAKLHQVPKSEGGQWAAGPPFPGGQPRGCRTKTPGLLSPCAHMHTHGAPSREAR